MPISIPLPFSLMSAESQIFRTLTFLLMRKLLHRNTDSHQHPFFQWASSDLHADSDLRWDKAADAEWLRIINQTVPFVLEHRGGMGQMFREIMWRGSESNWLYSSWASWENMLVHSARILIWHAAPAIIAVLTPLDFNRLHLCSTSHSFNPCSEDSERLVWSVFHYRKNLHEWICFFPTMSLFYV